jgi:hypothetical protein
VEADLSRQLSEEHALNSSLQAQVATLEVTLEECEQTKIEETLKREAVLLREEVEKQSNALLRRDEVTS